MTWCKVSIMRLDAVRHNAYLHEFSKPTRAANAGKYNVSQEGKASKPVKKGIELWSRCLVLLYHYSRRQSLNESIMIRVCLHIVERFIETEMGNGVHTEKR
jgi:hypothetical protein